MNPPNSIPLLGPETMYNPLVKLNLPKIAKNLQKIYKKFAKILHFLGFEAMRGH